MLHRQSAFSCWSGSMQQVYERLLFSFKNSCFMLMRAKFPGKNEEPIKAKKLPRAEESFIYTHIDICYLFKNIDLFCVMEYLSNI